MPVNVAMNRREATAQLARSDSDSKAAAEKIAKAFTDQKSAFLGEFGPLDNAIASDLMEDSDSLSTWYHAIVASPMLDEKSDAGKKLKKHCEDHENAMQEELKTASDAASTAIARIRTLDAEESARKDLAPEAMKFGRSEISSETATVLAGALGVRLDDKALHKKAVSLDPYQYDAAIGAHQAKMGDYANSEVVSKETLETYRHMHFKHSFEVVPLFKHLTRFEEINKKSAKAPIADIAEFNQRLKILGQALHVSGFVTDKAARAYVNNIKSLLSTCPNVDVAVRVENLMRQTVMQRSHRAVKNLTDKKPDEIRAGLAKAFASYAEYEKMCVIKNEVLGEFMLEQVGKILNDMGTGPSGKIDGKIAELDRKWQQRVDKIESNFKRELDAVRRQQPRPPAAEERDLSRPRDRSRGGRRDAGKGKGGKQPCRDWEAQGSCPRGTKCWFRHGP
jgi:hypothetical protein